MYYPYPQQHSLRILHLSHHKQVPEPVLPILQDLYLWRAPNAFYQNLVHFETAYAGKINDKYH
ncbi:hypothetical protein D3C85_1394610 [compost metagenome]